MPLADPQPAGLTAGWCDRKDCATVPAQPAYQMIFLLPVCDRGEADVKKAGPKARKEGETE
jgi:hypothetical protein